MPFSYKFFQWNRLHGQFLLIIVMNVCILFFSQTISESLMIPSLKDITFTEPKIVNNYGMLIFGTPVHRFNPSIESLSFVQNLPNGNGKRVILFYTYRLWKRRTFSKLKKRVKVLFFMFQQKAKNSPKKHFQIP